MNLDFSKIRALVIGDLMIDHYIFGTSERISPEAQVPVVLPQREFSIAGGAGNVANNLSELGARVTCVGTVGDDAWGEKLISIFNNQNINTKKIEKIKNHTTTIKKRIYSDGKQVARIDNEKFLSKWVPKNNIEYEDYDIIILSDYNKGIFHNSWFDANKTDIFLDPKKPNDKIFDKAKIITPNLSELKFLTNSNINNDKSLVDACSKLIRKYDFKYVIAKKGSEGITVVSKDDSVKNILGKNVEHPDVTGAGDTVISTLALAYFQTRDIILSAEIANAAASIVVSKPGTSTTNVKEIKELFLK